MPSYNALTTRNSIPYQVRWAPQSSIEEQWVSGANQTTVFCSVDWDDVPQWKTDMLGDTQVFGSLLYRYLPERNPWTPTQWCMDLKLAEAYGNPQSTLPPADPLFNNWPTLDKAVYRATFVAPEYEIKDHGEITYEYERFMVSEYAESYRSVKIPGGAFKIVDDTKPANSSQLPIQETGVRQQGTQNLTLKWIDVPVVKWANIRACAGRVNSTAFLRGLDGNTDGFAAETVLFDNWKPIKRWTASGRRTWDIEFHLAIIQGVDTGSLTLTWNHYYSRSAAGFIRISSDGTSSGRKPYLTADLHNLFSFT